MLLRAAWRWTSMEVARIRLRVSFILVRFVNFFPHLFQTCLPVGVESINHLSSRTQFCTVHTVTAIWKVCMLAPCKPLQPTVTHNTLLYIDSNVNVYLRRTIKKPRKSLATPLLQKQFMVTNQKTESSAGNFFPSKSLTGKCVSMWLIDIWL